MSAASAKIALSGRTALGHLHIMESGEGNGPNPARYRGSRRRWRRVRVAQSSSTARSEIVTGPPGSG
jgi:hypothetical protein